MIYFGDIDWSMPGVKQSKIDAGIEGMGIAFIIENEVVHTMAIDKKYADLFCAADDFSEESIDEQSGTYIVNINKNGVTLDQAACNEMLYAIFLSDPVIKTITNQNKYANLVAPGWKWIDNDFRIPGEYE
jgi:hypothetical protein